MSKEIGTSIEKGKTAFRETIAEIKGHDGGVRKKIFISAGLGAAVFGITWGAIPAAVIKELEWMKSLTPIDFNNSSALALGYGIDIIASLVNFNQERRFLKNKKIEISRDPFAAFIYHGLGKIESLKGKRGTRSVMAVSAPGILFFVTSALKEIPLIVSAVTLSPEGVQMLAVGKSAQGLFNLLGSGAEEFVLQTLGRERKKAQILPAQAVIADLKPKS